MRKATLAIIIFTVLSLFIMSDAQQFEYINSALWNNINCVDVVDDYAYCAFGSGLVVLDISDPYSIIEISRHYLPGSSNWIDVEGNLAYISNYDYGLHIVDITDPHAPYTVSQYSSSKQGYGIQAENDYAYLKTIDSVSTTFEFINVSDPTQPVFEGSYTIDERFWTNMRVRNTVDRNAIAYIAGSHSGFIILDISDPSSPDTLSIIQTEYSYCHIDIEGAYAYVTGTTPNGPPYGAFFAINIADPENPYQTDIEQAYDPFGNIIACDGVLYVQYSEGGRTTIWDLADPSSPDYLNVYYPQGFASSFGYCIADNKAYFSLPSDGLEIVSVASPSTPFHLGMFNIIYGLMNTIPYENYLICITLMDGALIFDISDPFDLNIVSNIDLNTSRTLLVDNYLYALHHWRGLNVYDISNPEQPELTDSLIINGGGYLDMYENAIYIQGVFDSWDRFFILDKSNPANPVLTDSIITDYDRLYNMHIHENHLFFTLNDTLNPGFIIYDISEPMSPVFIDYYETDYRAYGMAFKDEYAYVALNEYLGYIHQLLILDISNIDEPELLATLDMNEYIRSPHIYENMMFIRENYQDVKVYDISAPAEPIYSETIYTGAWNSIYGISFNDNYIYLSTSHCMMILQFTTSGIEEITDMPLTHFISTNYPNPFNASTTIKYNLPITSDVTLDIYDILGRKVETLVNKEHPAGYHQVIWNADGFSSGVYFYKLQAGDYSETKKMILLK